MPVQIVLGKGFDLEILTNSAKICLTGGTEIMSSLPMLVRNVRFGTALGKSYVMEDHIKQSFPNSYTGITLQKTAEDVAKERSITREDVDKFAVESHLKWKTAQEANLFDLEITKLKTTINKKDYYINKDELPNPEISVEQLGTLSSIVEDGSIVTAGNSASAADGAAALLLASEETVISKNLTPLARLTGWACVGVGPRDTQLGAVPAIKTLINCMNVKIEDIDQFEINETFASQTFATIKELKIDESKVNVNGGALALGHPVSATGARMATHLVHQLRSNNLNMAIAASCCGGGQGIAVMFEKI